MFCRFDDVHKEAEPIMDEGGKNTGVSENTRSGVLDALVIGKGPAGLQAALHIARSGLSIAVAGHDAGSLERAERIENYFGLSEPLSGADLQNVGESQVRAFGVDIHDVQVVGFGYTDEGFYRAISTGGEYAAKALVIATGLKRAKAPVGGLERYEGVGVSYCAVCDGFLYRGKRVGVLGAAEYAVSEARDLAAHASPPVILFTNGEKPVSDEFESETEPIERLEGDGRLVGVRLRDGRFRELDGLFVAYGTAGGDALAKKLGVLLNERGEILVDDRQATNVPGVYAAGDCTGAFRQVAVAVGQGAIAARSAIEYVRNNQA